MWDKIVAFFLTSFIILTKTDGGRTVNNLCVSPSAALSCDSDAECTDSCIKDFLGPTGKCGPFRSTQMCYCNGCAIINKAVFNSSSGHDDQPPAEYFCYFYTNQTYSCKTDCEPNGEDQKLNSSTNGSNVNFYDMLCKSNMPLSSDKRWKIGPHSIVSGQHRQTNTAHDSEILATCSFYKSMVFDCNGVTDCKEADNENRCGSAAPWSGRYSGSPENGFKVDGTIVRTGSDAGNG